MTPLQEMINNLWESQQQCADELGWSKQKLSNIARGKQSASIQDAKELARVLNTSIDVIAKKILSSKSTKI